MDNKTLVERLEVLRNHVACLVKQVPDDWADAMVELRDDLTQAMEAAAALRATGEPATVDLGEHGLLRNATVKGVTVTAARPDQVQGCCFMGEGIPRPTVQYSVAADSVIGPFPADPANMGIKAERATAMCRAGVDAAINAAPNRWCPPAYRAMLAAAPTPAEPLRDAPTNPGEISSKVVEPLRDAGAVAWIAPEELQRFEGEPKIAACWGSVTLSSGEGDGRTVPLYLHPAPQQPAITDAMVERALEGWCQHQERCRFTTVEGSLRKALEAALTAAQEGKP